MANLTPAERAFLTDTNTNKAKPNPTKQKPKPAQSPVDAMVRKVDRLDGWKDSDYFYSGE